MVVSLGALLPVALLLPAKVSLCVSSPSQDAQRLHSACCVDAAAIFSAAWSDERRRFSIDLCDAEALCGRRNAWAPDASLSREAIAGDGDKIALLIFDDGGVIDRREMRLRLLHGVLLHHGYDPSDASRRGSIAAPGGDGEAREMAVAERALLRRLGWEGVPLLCSTDLRPGR